jgi:Undecaprenyl-phosphate galactose phosphotransferase WbaP
MAPIPHSQTPGARQRTIRAATLLVADLGAFLLAWFMAVVVSAFLGKALWPQWFPLTTLSGIVFTVMSLLVVLALAGSGQYVRRNSYWEEVGTVWRYAAMAALVNFALNFFVQVSYTRTLLLLAWVFAFVNIPLVRVIARELLMRFGCWKRMALLVGDGENAAEACDAMRRERHMGIDISGRVGRSSALAQFAGIPVYDFDEGVETVAQRLGCEIILLALGGRWQVPIASVVNSLHQQKFEVFVVPALQGLPVHSMQAQHFFSNDVLFLRLQYKLFSRWSQLLKRSIDIVIASAMLLALSPLMIFVAWRIWREDGTPVLYVHRRVGANGEDFDFIKFRSMVRDADAALASWKTDNPELYEKYHASNFKLANDPRMLKTGAWTRRSSIDELPQLWNVLRGDMSLVGPRPLLRRELPKYSEPAMALYEQVRPGITGLWQVNGRSHTTFEQRAAMDSWYVRNWSLWVDWVILLKTVHVVLSGRGAL